MNGTAQLQLAAIALLWLQLCLQGQLQGPVAFAIPLVLVLGNLTTLPKAARQGLTIAALGIWASGAQLGDRTALLQSGSNLLWLLCSLKWLEARQPRDQQRCALVLLLAVGLAGLGDGSLSASLLQLAVVLLAVASLLGLYESDRPLPGLLQRSGLLVALALPIVIASFLLLPRLEPLWSVQLQQPGRTGLSERLAPGELAALVEDDGLAARVSFARDQLPPPEQRYWRVLVHQSFNGNAWTGLDTQATPAITTTATPAQDPALESWLVEANSLRQLPWSGRGLPLEADLRTNRNGSLEQPRPTEQRTLYALGALQQPAAWQQHPPTAADLATPQSSNPKLKALGQQWARQGSTNEQRLQLAEAWFKQQGFRYTLEPGSLGSLNPLDGFLFHTKAGFCEHFAASFSALMREAGVPARVIVGYQGGRWRQPAGGPNYLELRNSDAHAWSEIWLPAKGWVPVDPTAWVAPERIRQSLASSLSPRDQARLRRSPGWLSAVIDQWQGLDYRWQLWVMGFDRQRQQELFGNRPQQGLWAIAAITLAAGLGLMPVLLRLQRRTRSDAMGRQLQQLLHRLARRGYPLRPGETLAEFCHRLATTHPEQAVALAELSSRYDQWRFGPGPKAAGEAATLRALIQHCQRRLKA